MNLETERLYLKPTDKKDAAFILNLVNTPTWIKYIGDKNVNSKKDAEDYIEEKYLKQQERIGFSNFTVILKSNCKKIGVCGLYDRKGIEGLDVGFALLPKYEGQGFAFESATKIIEMGRAHLGIQKIKAITTKDNISSQRLLENVRDLAKILTLEQGKTNL